ncbi:MAG: phosphotransferase [Granulosicoccaceae bacterium]
MPKLLAVNDKLEKDAGPFEINFCHNDFLAGNFLDDGTRLWLIDWDYAGFNSPLFDLGGLASNNELSEQQEHRLLEIYFDKQPSAQRLKQFYAMKCASLLRETMWSMVSEVYSTINFDYAAYSVEYLSRFESAITHFKQA